MLNLQACAVALIVVLLAPGLAAADEVAGIDSSGGEPEVVLVLDNGDVLNGRLLSTSEDRVVIEHPVLGRIEVPTSLIAEPMLTKEEAEAAAAAAATEEAEPEEEKEKPGLFGSSFLRGWTRSVSIGLSGADGNADTFDFNATLDLGYEDDHYRLKSSSAYFVSLAESRKTANGPRKLNTTKNQAYSQLDADWLFPGHKWFAFSVSRWDFDEFKNFDHRIAISGGPGYQMIDDDRFKLAFKLGPGFNRTFGGTDPKWTFELFAGFDFTWVINEYLTFSTANTIFPNLSDTGEFRTVSTADLTANIGDSGFSVKAGLLNEYNTQVRPKKNDLNYYGNLVYDF